MLEATRGIARLALPISCGKRQPTTQAGDLARDHLGGGLAHICLFSFGGLAGLILAAVGLGLGALLDPEVEVQAVHVGEGADVLDEVLLFRCFLLQLLVGEQA